MGVSDVITLLGGVALFLYGMSLMGDGLKKVAGNKLELVLYRLSSTPLKGVLLGTGVTAVIQSSSATSVMVVGFVNSGMMQVKQAIGVVMGAILGTSITGWILCLSDLSGGSGWVELLSTATLTGVVAIVGIILRMAGKKQSTLAIGNILMGFAVLMFGMSAMSDAVAPLKESEAFTGILTSFSNPFLGILVGIAFTSILQSASAAVGILQALAITGAVTFEVAFPIIMGIAIGAAVPVLLSALGANIHGRRTAFVYLLIDVLGVIIWATVFYVVNAFVHFSFMPMTMTTVSIALLNTLFRLATVIVLTPCIGLLERFVCFLIPDKRGADPAQLEMDRLEERFLQHPALAIEQSREVTAAMANTACSNLTASLDLISNYSDKGFQSIEDKENTIDRFEDKLGTYLVRLSNNELSENLSHSIARMLHSIGDFERIGDHALNICKVAEEMHNKGISFSDEAKREIAVITNAVTEILNMTVDSFVNDDIETASHVEPLEQVIDKLNKRLKARHVTRLQNGECTIELGFVFTDLLTNYERVSDHCSNIAVYTMQLPSDKLDAHKYLAKIKNSEDGTFVDDFNMYSEKYSLNNI